MTILRDSLQKRISIYIDKYKANVFMEPVEVQNPKPLQNDQDDQFKVKLIGESMNYPLGATPGLWTGGQPIIYDGKEYISTNTIVD